jgi:hypothetical protein
MLHSKLMTASTQRKGIADSKSRSNRVGSINAQVTHYHTLTLVMAITPAAWAIAMSSK